MENKPEVYGLEFTHSLSFPVVIISENTPHGVFLRGYCHKYLSYFILEIFFHRKRLGVKDYITSRDLNLSSSYLILSLYSQRL